MPKELFKKDENGKYPVLFWGQAVNLYPAYGAGKKYFVCYLSDGFCLIADSKKDCQKEEGYIHSLSNINSYDKE